MSGDKKIERVEVGWSGAVVMICTDCGKVSAERIKKDLKSLAKTELEKGSVRIINSTCLNICPVDKIAIVVADKKNSDLFKGYAADPEISASDLFKKILKK